jgi:ribonuclease HI
MQISMTAESTTEPATPATESVTESTTPTTIIGLSTFQGKLGEVGNVVRIYAEGVCKKNPGPGGWGAVLAIDGFVTEISGGELNATSNQMDMMAVISTLRLIPSEHEIMVRTHSQCVVQGMTKWLVGWKENDWKTGKKNLEVKNKDLWIQLDALAEGRNITWECVKGIKGCPENQRAEKMAGEFVIRLMTPMNRVRGRLTVSDGNVGWDAQKRDIARTQYEYRLPISNCNVESINDFRQSFPGQQCPMMSKHRKYVFSYYLET